jgi:small subunit ribosomal protein S17
MNTTRNQRRTIEGTVTSAQCAKTITVQVERTYKHPKYKKYVRKTARYHAHDEKSEAKTGDRVEIQSCRPLSKTKRWTLVRVIDRSKRGALVDVTSGIVEAPKAAQAAGTRDGGGS